MADRNGLNAITADKIRFIAKKASVFSPNLSDFELKFIRGTLQKFNTYGTQMVMSAKQINIVSSIYDKLRER